MITNQKIKKNYCDNIDSELQKLDNKNWESITNVVKKAAEQHIGFVKDNISKHEYSEVIEELSNKQKLVRLEINTTTDITILSQLKSKRNKILKEIKYQQKLIRDTNIDRMVEDIDNAQNDRKMYKAVKVLNRPTRKANDYIHDKDGKCITNKYEINQVIKEHFNQHFYDETVPQIQAFVGEPRHLKNQITPEEVQTSIRKMSNNKCPGEDEIQVEMLKYGPPSLIDEITKVLNNIFKNHEDTVNIGRSILIPLQKPNKTKGPVTNRRAINLLNTIRKVMSNITLNRINDKVNEYLAQSQAAYRKGRSTTDILWAHKFVAAKVQKYKNLEIYITGIDMSSAFDTIHRHKLLEEMETFLGEDEIRMTRILLSNITIRIRTNDVLSESFISNLGSPQGDGLSGTLFNIKFESALRKIRAQINIQQPMIEHSYIKRPSPPEELTYADDCDFENDDKEKTKLINSIVAPTLKEENLIVNESKTEHPTIKRGNRLEETWRGVKKLGSLLGDSEDLIRRKQLSCAAMNKIKSMWLGKKTVGIKRRIKIYNSLVKSVLLYNSCTWGLTKGENKRLDAHHRRQLRTLWKRRKMSNKQVYALSNAKPVSAEVKEARWRMFGHSLRLHIQTPAQQAMTYYFQDEPRLKKYKGRPRTTLPSVLNADIKAAKTKYPEEMKLFNKFDNIADLNRARIIAKDRQMWKELSKLICSIA